MAQIEQSNIYTLLYVLIILMSYYHYYMHFRPTPQRAPLTIAPLSIARVPALIAMSEKIDVGTSGQTPDREIFPILPMAQPNQALCPVACE
jgi:hypothetical protein